LKLNHAVLVRSTNNPKLVSTLQHSIGLLQTSRIRYKALTSPRTSEVVSFHKIHLRLQKNILPEIYNYICCMNRWIRNEK